MRRDKRVLVMIWISLAVFILGVLTFGVGYFFNSSTPQPVGPVPTIGGAFVALVGLMMVVRFI